MLVNVLIYFVIFVLFYLLVRAAPVEPEAKRIMTWVLLAFLVLAVILLLTGRAPTIPVWSLFWNLYTRGYYEPFSLCFDFNF